MSRTIELQIEGTVARVTLARPQRRNAFDTAMLKAMEDVVTELGRRPEVTVVALQALGPSFCAGTDLTELQGLSGTDTLHWQRRTGELIERWTRLEATTLTAFQGPAVGSGAVIGLASDLRIAADATWFSFPEVGFGIPLTWSGVALLAGLIGADRIKRALLLQERLEAAEILSLGLVSEIVPTADLPQRVDELVRKLAGTSALARLMTKRATAAAHAAPGFLTTAYEPFLAAQSIEHRGAQPFAKDPSR